MYISSPSSHSKLDASFGPALLSSLLPLGSSLMDTLTPLHTSSNSAIFKDFFECLVSLAGTNKSDGHLRLAQEVVGWIPQCAQLAPAVQSHDSQVTGSEGEETSEKAKKPATDSDKLLAPVDSIFLYLSQLTTAVQFSGNVAEYTERRGVAGEDDLLFDEDEGGEEVGGAGGGAEEDEASTEDSVSCGFYANC